MSILKRWTLRLGACWTDRCRRDRLTQRRVPLQVRCLIYVQTSTSIIARRLLKLTSTQTQGVRTTYYTVHTYGAAVSGLCLPSLPHLLCPVRPDFNLVFTALLPTDPVNPSLGPILTHGLHHHRADPGTGDHSSRGRHKLYKNDRRLAGSGTKIALLPTYLRRCPGEDAANCWSVVTPLRASSTSA
ncbi:hypothetical protein F5B20DRAFT_497660 [Whalleya microplaca]|nr:hypothetical protein F5B20DRAFT_497660 [Whalleya microplaca]